VDRLISQVNKEMSKKKANKFSTYQRHIILLISIFKKEKEKINK
jgi:hypothetical protein